MRANIYLLVIMISACLAGCNSDNEKVTDSNETATISNALNEAENCEEKAEDIISDKKENAGEVQQENVLEPIPDRSFESGLDTSFYFEMIPADAKTYELLKTEYAKIDFSADFQKGDRNTYDDYYEKYFLLINNKIPYYDKDDKEVWFRDIDSVKDGDGNSNIENNKYYLFDADGDGGQELYVRTLTNRLYVFKYEVSTDKISVWYVEEDTPYYYFMGTQAKAWSNDGLKYAFYHMDKNADEDVVVVFEEIYDINPKTNESESVYMITIPEYVDSNMKIHMTRELQEQAYYIDGRYYFCVTKEQYDELTDKFFEMNNSVRERLAEVEVFTT